MQGASRKTEWNVKIWLCRVMIDLGEKDEMAMGVYIIQHGGFLYGWGGEALGFPGVTIT